MNYKIRCGGSYCEVCKKCISPPRMRKTFIEDWWTTCEKCEPDIVRILFKPREECVTTDFHVSYKDIPALIKQLEKAHEEHKAENEKKDS